MIDETGLDGPTGTSYLTPDVIAVLREMRVDGNLAFIDQPLDRDLYQRVNKALEALGGKWNRKLRGHVFDGDPSERLMQAVVTEEVVDPKKAFGFFETPAELASSMVVTADPGPGMRVLEPSAGRGAIADMVRDRCPGCDIEVVEIDPRNRKALKEKGYKLVGKDFLKFRKKGYDRIVMNPPFNRQQDIDHVMHAYGLLAPGGRLVSIMAASVKFRANKKTIAFQNLVQANGTIEDLAPETFKESGTSINTVMVTLEKN
jgi:predicted RNA methylase